MTEVAGVLINSGELTLAKERKEIKRYDGATVTVIEYGERVEGSLSATLLADSTVATLVSAAEAWVTEQATGDVFGLPAGGTAIVSDIKVSESNEEASTASVSVTYFPNVVSES